MLWFMQASFFLVHLQLIVIYCRTKFERMAFENASAEATVQRTTQISTHDLGKMRERDRALGSVFCCCAGVIGSW